MMKRMTEILKHIAVVLLLLVLLGACNVNKTDKEINTVTVSILPQKYFIDKISNNKLKVNVLIPSGSSPETYEPSPSQLIKLEKSQLYFEMGYLEIERNRILNFLKNNQSVKVVNCSDGIDLIKKNGRWVEPHIWMSTKNAKIIAKNIYHAIVDIDSTNKSVYRENLQKFLSEIEQLDKKIREKLKDVRNKKFLIYHPALTYFAKDYGLEQIPLQVEGKPPSSKYLKAIIEKAKEEGIRTIVVQQQFDIEKAKTIAGEINGTVITINPLDYNWEEEMLDIADKLSRSLR